MFSFGGFGTLGVVHSSEDDADFTASDFQPGGAGYSHSWSAAVDSLVGAQVAANITPKWSAVLQLVAQQNYNNTYTPHVEWANIKYQMSPDFSVRVGRTALPIFMVTDSREVGYANPWVRPPLELYRLVPVTSNDGVDASYRLAVAGGTNTTQLTAGRSDIKFANTGPDGAGTAQARNVIALADTYEREFLTVRASFGRARLTVAEFGELFDAFRHFGPPGIAIAELYDEHNRLATFRGVGASYDPGDWFVMGEWGDINAHSVLGDNAGWYATGGYRLQHFTPFITYAEVKARGTTSSPGLDVAQLPPYLAAPATELNAALNSILGASPTQSTASAGMRWDFMKDLDFKLQFDHTRHGAGSAGTLTDIQPEFRPGGIVNIFSATVDFVF